LPNRERKFKNVRSTRTGRRERPRH
jgi:hypothetical protein